MQHKGYLTIHPHDNVAVALTHLHEGSHIVVANNQIVLRENILAKHKFACVSIAKDEPIIMYGITVGTAKSKIDVGTAVTTQNVEHKTTPVFHRQRISNWHAPSTEKWANATFMGYHRKDGSVGTANYWLVFPLVFCENKNIEVIKEAIYDAMGYNKYQEYKSYAKQQLNILLGRSENFDDMHVSGQDVRPFKNVDGVKFITHQMGCGGTRQDAQALCGLLAGYLTNPNVAGATILSLGCQNAQFDLLKEEIKSRDSHFDKPMYYFDQQTLGREEVLIKNAIKATLEGIAIANEEERKAAPLSKLVIGLECGGSDGFSGISANPTVGHVSDLVVALGGSTVLAEFPELCGVEQELCNRCASDDIAQKFLDLMRRYEKAAINVGSGFDMNPSPGNIKDGLITDAMKSAGAAKKGGTASIVDVLDYPQKVKKHGLNLLNTPGNDVESTTALAAAGCNIILFTTGLGTPTGNPIVPVIKISSNTNLAQRMPDIIDFDTGQIIDGKDTIDNTGNRLMEYVLNAASGYTQTKATINQQNDFIPWKRGVSL